MQLNRYVLNLLPDFIIVIGIAFYNYNYNKIEWKLCYFILGFIGLKMVFFFIVERYIDIPNLKILKNGLKKFKKGKFIIKNEKIKYNNAFLKIYNDLILIGKHFDNIISSQKGEIDKFHEIFNSVIYQLDSHFIGLDEDDRVVFVNESFCKKFLMERDDFIGVKFDKIFYFVNAHLKGGIAQVKKNGKSIIVEKVHLFSLNKVSIIADVKISKINSQAGSQIFLVFDEVSKIIRHDYNLGVMSQISESIKENNDIENILYFILNSVTSGAGFGFDRAMIFLEDEDNCLAGRLAVGPDSFDEALKIWESVNNNRDLLEKKQIDKKYGINLLNKVKSARFPLNKSNILTNAFKTKKIILNKDSVENGIVDFIDCDEFIVAPLVADSHSIGIIVVDNKFNKTPILKETVEFLSNFVSQAAVSIQSYNNLKTIKLEMEKISEKQEAIVESEKMAAVGRIASHIAHEIRNPLVTMGGYARRIALFSNLNSTKSGSKNFTNNKENINKSAQIILRESERLEKILSNVMDFTRPAKYLLEFNSMNEVIDDTFDLLKNLFLEKKINVIKSLDENLPLVKSDFNQMKQVILNLVQNSVDATPVNGIIEVVTRGFEKNVVIKIKDTGSGIDAEDPNTIFEPFFTTKVTGVGLGLATVKKIIKDHRGEIKVRNREDDGVEFLINIPLPE